MIDKSRSLKMRRHGHGEGEQLTIGRDIRTGAGAPRTVLVAPRSEHAHTATGGAPTPIDLQRTPKFGVRCHLYGYALP